MREVPPVEDVEISPWPVDVVEFSADAYAHRKQVDSKQLYNQMPHTAWVCSRQWVSSREFELQLQLKIGCPRSENLLQTEGLDPQWPTVEQPSIMRKKCCYGQKNFGSICSSLSPSPTHLSHTTHINPFE